MPAPIPIEKVHKELNKRKLKLVSNYLNASTPMTVKCPNNHLWMTKLVHITSCGARCPHCQGISKKSVTEVREFLNTIKVNLLSKEYNNNKEHLSVQCQKCNTKYKARFDQMKNSSKKGHNRCPECAKTKRNAKSKTTIEKIKSDLPEGYCLIKADNNLTKRYGTITVKCSKNHLMTKTYNRFCLTKFKCRECDPVKRKTLKDYQALAKEKNITLLSKEIPKTSEYKASWQCKKNHKFELSFISVTNCLNPCSRCTGRVIRTDENLAEQCLKMGLKFVRSERTHKGLRCEISCLKCSHNWNTAFTNLTQGHSCPACSKKVSLSKKRNSVKKVSKLINSTEFTLLTDLSIYQNNQTKLLFKCKMNHEFISNLGYIRAGKGCSICSKVKVTFEMSRNEGKRIGLTVISKEYKDQHSPMIWSCKKGHSVKASYAEVKRRSSCPVCRPVDTAEHRETHPAFDRFFKSNIKGLVLVNPDLKLFNEVGITLGRKRPDRIIFNPKTREFIFVELKHEDKDSFSEDQIINYKKIGKNHGNRYRGTFLVSENGLHEECISFTELKNKIKQKLSNR